MSKKKVSTYSIDQSRRTVTYRAAQSKGMQTIMWLCSIGVVAFVVGTILCVMIAQDAPRLPRTSQFDTFDLVNSGLDAATAYGRFVTESTTEFVWEIAKASPFIVFIAWFVAWLHNSLKSSN